MRNESRIDNRGLYRKFKVERVDGSSLAGGKHSECYHFVLDLTHDPHAIPAIKAYAESCSAEYPQLSKDLISWALKKEPDSE